MINFLKKLSKQEELKMEVTTVQIALFYDALPTRADRFAAKISDGFENRFDKIPTTIPIQEGTPKDAPVIIQESSISNDRITVARSRCDLFLYPIETGENNLAQFVAKQKRFIVEFYEKVIEAGADIRRVGVILNAGHFEEKPVGTISNAISGKYADAYELNLRVNQRVEKKGIIFNQVRDFSSVVATDPEGNKRPVLLFTYDINTAPELKEILPKDVIRDSVDFAFEQFESHNEDIFH